MSCKVLYNLGLSMFSNFTSSLFCSASLLPWTHRSYSYSETFEPPHFPKAFLCHHPGSLPRALQMFAQTSPSHWGAHLTSLQSWPLSSSHPTSLPYFIFLLSTSLHCNVLNNLLILFTLSSSNREEIILL